MDDSADSWWTRFLQQELQCAPRYYAELYSSLSKSINDWKKSSQKHYIVRDR